MSNNTTHDHEMYEAKTVRSALNRIRYLSTTSDILYLHDVLDAFATEVVEQGTWTPDCGVSASLSLTYRERLTGSREQDMTTMLTLGMLLGSALEQDAPTDTARETAWENGRFVLPDRDDSDDETETAGETATTTDQ